MTTTTIPVIHNTQFSYWTNIEDGEMRYIVTDTNTNERICDTRYERTARNIYRMVVSQDGWWNNEGKDNGR